MGTKAYTRRARLLKALAHPVRLQILDILRHGDEYVCHLEAVLGRRQSYISQQLMILRDVGLVDSHKDGLHVFYRLVDSAMIPLLESALGPPERKRDRNRASDCPCPKCTAILATPNGGGNPC